MRMRRLATFSVLITSLLMGQAFVMVGTAGAVPPVRVPLSFPPGGIDLPAGAYCPWAGHIDADTLKEKITTFFDQQGNVAKIMITGALKITVTNVETGGSLSLNIPGSSVFDPETSTLVYRGLNVIFPVPGQMPLVSGQVVVSVAPDGTQSILSVEGTTVDLCAQLA
jgi:hypothetical protein